MKNEEGTSKGFGFVDFVNVEAAKNAVKKNGEKYGGRALIVDFSTPKGVRRPFNSEQSKGGFEKNGFENKFGDRRGG